MIVAAIQRDRQHGVWSRKTLDFVVNAVEANVQYNNQFQQQGL